MLWQSLGTTADVLTGRPFGLLRGPVMARVQSFLIVLGALLMRGGVGFCMVPLLAIGTGQVADARKLCPGIMAFHVDVPGGPADCDALYLAAVTHSGSL